MIQWFLDLFRLKSPCCKSNMSSVFDMEHDSMVYKCIKCKREWI